MIRGDKSAMPKNVTQKSAFGILTLLVITTLLTGCSGLASQVRYLTSPPESGDLLYSDDFSTHSRWDTWNVDESIVDFSSGGLRFFVNQTNYDYWSVLDEYFVDTSIEVDAVKVNGPDDNRMGVICRYQDKENFYQFLISSDGYYGILKVLDGKSTIISGGQLEYSADVAAVTGEKVHIQAVCLGSSLTLSVNGTLLASAYDQDLLHGDVGLTAGANVAKPVDVLFDDFRVSQP